MNKLIEKIKEQLSGIEDLTTAERNILKLIADYEAVQAAIKEGDVKEL